MILRLEVVPKILASKPSFEQVFWNNF